MTRFICALFFMLCLCISAQSQDNKTQLQRQIDSLVQNAIDSSAFPGAQVLIIHKGVEILHKSYGYHTYDKIREVKDNHLYDLASLTKVMGGGLALMKMQEQGLFSSELTLSETHPYLARSNKADISWKSILAHQSRMEPYIVFWQTALKKNGKYKWRTFSTKKSPSYSIVIDDKLSLHRRYPRKMRKIIKNAPLESETKYLYSGLGFLLIPDLVHQRTGLYLDEFLRNEVYNKLNVERITFKPSLYYPIEEIVPTEIDTFFRKSLVHGYVHDENASMLNGVSANAGLFANATSLGKIAEWLRAPNAEIIHSDIIKEYTSVQFPDNDNRRGLTFDKPMLTYDSSSSYIAESASPSSFGHSGFTGTFIWIDPRHDLTFIFLSNRVHPFRSSRKLYTMNLRPKLHQLAYDYVLKETQ